jgi:hypothetical protein
MCVFPISSPIYICALLHHEAVASRFVLFNEMLHAAQKTPLFRKRGFDSQSMASLMWVKEFKDVIA